tara:strand:- start:416 stop:892 length:477 start_codon:yes stop_codon:yes gene_type:complete
MLSNIDSDKFALDNYSYYFAVYMPHQKSWFINNQRFLLSTANNKITGQYISSLWFKSKLDLKNSEHLRVAIIKLPKHYCMQKYSSRYTSLLNISDDPLELSFVAVYSLFNHEELLNLFTQLELHSSSVHKESEENISLSFCKSKRDDSILMYCPSFYL